MLTLYLTCLLVGGVFVGLSVFSGLDKDADLAADKDFDALVGDVDVDLDVDGGVDGHMEVEHASIAEASHGADDGRRRRRRKGIWLPILSFRFWTFGSAFFGLTGAVLTVLHLSVEPVTVGLSSAIGLAVGAAAAAIVRALQNPVGATKVTGRDFHGAVGELILPLKADGVSKVQALSAGAAKEFVAIADEGLAMPRGTAVVILGIDADGRARVAPEEQLFQLESNR